MFVHICVNILTRARSGISCFSPACCRPDLASTVQYKAGCFTPHCRSEENTLLGFGTINTHCSDGVFTFIY